MADLLNYAVQYKASDIHITVAQPPMLRISGKLLPSGYDRLAPDDCKQLVYSILTDKQKAQYEAEHELDFSISIPGVSRFRVNCFMQKSCVSAVLRAIGNNIPSVDELGVPQVIRNFAFLPRGLVLVTGPTGSGKSTTLASLINLANEEREDHIITIEDPIEFVHPHRRCTVNQRELGSDTHSFAKALKGVLRQDPDIVLVGELRDLETIAAAITLAETGHVVFSTLHTQDAAQTVDRMVDVFPPYQQEQIRIMLSAGLKGVVCQILLPRADGEGRVAAQEILVVTPAVAAILREGKTHQIYSAIQTGGSFGMITMDQSIYNLLTEGLITEEVALSKANNPDEVKRMIKQAAK